MVASGGGDVGVAGPAKQIEGGVAAGGEIGRGSAGADLAGVFAEGYIAHVMQAVLDLPVATPKACEPTRVSVPRRHASQGVRPLPLALARPRPTDILDFAQDPADLREGRPARDRAGLAVLRVHGFGLG